MLKEGELMCTTKQHFLLSLHEAAFYFLLRFHPITDFSQKNRKIAKPRMFDVFS